MVTNIFDFNNLAIRAFCSKEVGADTEAPDIRLWKYFTIDSVYKSLFKDRDINEIVLAIDDRKSWRKLYWNRYKESRKKKRDTSKINWNVFHEEYNLLTEEIRTTLPFKTIQVENAEADDVIAILCKKDDGTYVVISNDEDYTQLCSDRILVYNPQKMEFLKCDNTEMFVVRACLTGQSKDDIFNIKTPLDWPEGKRKPGFGPKSADTVVSQGYIDWLKENKLEERFNVNRILIDFNKIPNVIKTRIMNTYNSYKLPDPSGMYHFFEKNGFKGYIEEFTTVENMLMRLY